MHYFYGDFEVAGDTANLTDPEQVHHIRDVVRLKTGEKVTVFDNAGYEYLCTIASLEKKWVSLKIESRKNTESSGPLLAIACAVPKLSGLDDIIDKLTQLGVDVIIPLQTDRVVVRPQGVEPAKVETRQERWRKIARSAAEQSHRRSLPHVTGLMNLSDVLAQSAKYQMRLIATVSGSRKTLPEIITGSQPVNTLALIGPEGDFAPEEVQAALEVGFIAISLGKTVLRVDTAAIALAGYLALARTGLC
jgi:16S rRNA (uracil1498-N3)-methyltransferase